MSPFHHGPKHSDNASRVADRDLYMALMVDFAPLESGWPFDESAPDRVVADRILWILLQRFEVEVEDSTIEPAELFIGGLPGVARKGFVSFPEVP